MRLQTTREETTQRLLSLGICPNHPAHRLAPGKKVCWECYDLSKADAHDEAHGDPLDEEV